MKLENKPIINSKSTAFLFEADPIFKDIFDQYGLPPNWKRNPGFETLSRIILEQQVSLESAHAAYLKLKTYCIDFTPENIAQLTHEQLRTCYVSRQKATYIKGLAQAILDKQINLADLENLHPQTVREKLTTLKGIGNWTCDVYLMFCLQSPDFFPMGDIAAVNTVKLLKNVAEKEAVLAISESWSPFRTAATYFLWHYYLNKRNRSIQDIFYD